MGAQPCLLKRSQARPERNRHRRNEPAFVKSVLLKLAEVRDTDPAALAKTVWENTCRLYNIESKQQMDCR